MLSDHYDETVQVERMTAVQGSTTKKRYTTHIASLACHIQPFDDRISQDKDVGFGKNLLLFCDNCDIQEGDKVVWDSTDYRVVAVEDNFTFLKRARQLEVKIRAFQS